MIEYLITNWILFMVVIFLLTSSSCVCHHVTRKDRILTATRIHEDFDPEMEREIRLGLRPVILTSHEHFQPTVED